MVSSRVLLSRDVPDPPLDVRVRVRLDEGVDRADLARLVVPLVVGVRPGALEVAHGRDGHVLQRPLRGQEAPGRVLRQLAALGGNVGLDRDVAPVAELLVELWGL